jgi:hypothetical protein
MRDRGNPKSQVWVVVDQPEKRDSEKNFVFSSGIGFIFERMMHEAGINDFFVTYLRDREDPKSYRIPENALNHHRPPLIITLEDATKTLVPETRKKLEHRAVKKLTPSLSSSAESSDYVSDIESFAGSLLFSSKLHYPHYVIPTFSPLTVIKDWSLRDIVVSIDLGKVKSELDYFRAHGHLEPLPERQLIIDFDDFDRLRVELLEMLHADLISTDTESIYPRAKSIYKNHHPGIPVVIGMAREVTRGISFNLFRESKTETMELWRLVQKIFDKVRQLGQNFHIFDQNHLEALGFSFRHNPYDTMLRHAVLWPELPHKLQFLTRQYTREPYYKDEGHGWSRRDMSMLKRYNVKDCCVTLEVYNEQEKEFAERPTLR